MRHIPVRRILPPLAAVILVGAALVYLTSVSSAAAGRLRASGTIESVEVGVASEVPGRVSEVLAEEGEAVAQGDLLLRLDASLLEAQRRSAAAAGRAAIAAARMELTAARQALDVLDRNAPVARAQAELALADAQDALEDAQYTHRVRQEGNRATEETIEGARYRLRQAREKLDEAQDEYDRARGDAAKALAYDRYASAKNSYDSALATYNWYTGHPTGIEQAQLVADVALAQAQLDDAKRRVEDLRDGPDPEALALAHDRLTLASAQLAAAQAKSDLDIDLLDLQLEKLRILAPLDGVVLSRSIEPGEVLSAGAPALSIGDVNQLTITVYLPEDRYGEVSLGDGAIVTVDSFPGVPFEARVVRIAEKAEFTPRNVQTEEGRRTTVFAVELSVDDPSGRLKPGMPADVEFADWP